MKNGTLWVIGAVLCGAIALQAFSLRDIKEGDRSAEVAPVGLAQRVPAELPGWGGRDEPLGPNEVVKTAVERILNFDDVVNRVYEKGAVRVGIYVAYWAPGRMPIQKVASHTPDRCWTENGWKCEQMRYDVRVQAREFILDAAQWRQFEPPGSTGQKEYVLYWHLVGGQPYDYGERFNATPHPLQWWRDTMKYAFSGSDAQYFIRLTSNRDFTEFENDPAWQQLLKTVASLGVPTAVVYP